MTATLKKTGSCFTNLIQSGVFSSLYLFNISSRSSKIPKLVLQMSVNIKFSTLSEHNVSPFQSTIGITAAPDGSLYEGFWNSCVQNLQNLPVRCLLCPFKGSGFIFTPSKWLCPLTSDPTHRILSIPQRGGLCWRRLSCDFRVTCLSSPSDSRFFKLQETDENNMNRVVFCNDPVKQKKKKGGFQINLTGTQRWRV